MRLALGWKWEAFLAVDFAAAEPISCCKASSPNPPPAVARKSRRPSDPGEDGDWGDGVESAVTRGRVSKFILPINYVYAAAWNALEGRKLLAVSAFPV